MRHIVTTRDNVQFVVDSDERTAPFDRQLAAHCTAEQLQRNTDFTPLVPLDPGPLEPPAPTPAERRAAFYVIRGGKS